MLYVRIVAEGKVGFYCVAWQPEPITVVYVRLECKLSIGCEHVSAGSLYSICSREMYSVQCCSDNCAA